MSRHRPIALLLLVTLLTALLPVSGEGCRLCGKIGRCCCLTRPAAKPAASHCSTMKMMQTMGGPAACSMDRSPVRPAAFRVPQTLPERTGALAGFFAALGRPETARLLSELQAPRPLRLSSAPPIPPPRVLRIV